MLYENGELAGVVRYAYYRDEGYFVGVELEADSRWSAADFIPEHLLDPEDVLPRGSSLYRNLVTN
jgi:hypothetical protein